MIKLMELWKDAGARFVVNFTKYDKMFLIFAVNLREILLAQLSHCPCSVRGGVLWLKMLALTYSLHDIQVLISSSYLIAVLWKLVSALYNIFLSLSSLCGS